MSLKPVYNLDDDGSWGFSAAKGSESDVNSDLGPSHNTEGRPKLSSHVG